MKLNSIPLLPYGEANGPIQTQCYYSPPSTFDWLLHCDEMPIFACCATCSITTTGPIFYKGYKSFFSSTGFTTSAHC